MNAYCTMCGTAFQARGRWQRLCRRCWREGHDLAIFERGYSAGFTDAIRARLDVQLLTDAIALCHPDRHPTRGEVANRVTAQLLELREQARRAA